MHTTNYVDTFIAVAPDSRAVTAEAPPSDPENPSIAARQFALLHEHPYEFTSDDVLFTVHADRAGRPASARAPSASATAGEPTTTHRVAWHSFRWEQTSTPSSPHLSGSRRPRR